MRYEYHLDHHYTEDAPINIVDDDDVHFSASFARFWGPVRFFDCTIRHFDLYATYFLGGLVMERCDILCQVNWQSGGHNSQPISIVDSTFHEFLDVEDCWFQDAVVLRNVTFRKDTNFLGNIGTPVEVRFETPLRFEGIVGRLDVDTFQVSSD